MKLRKGIVLADLAKICLAELADVPPLALPHVPDWAEEFLPG